MPVLRVAPRKCQHAKSLMNHQTTLQLGLMFRAAATAAPAEACGLRFVACVIKQRRGEERSALSGVKRNSRGRRLVGLLHHRDKGVSEASAPVREDGDGEGEVEASQR